MRWNCEYPEYPLLCAEGETDVRKCKMRRATQKLPLAAAALLTLISMIARIVSMRSGTSSDGSQPYIVALMTQLLEVGPVDRVLEVGSGSGYQAAIIEELAMRSTSSRSSRNWLRVPRRSFVVWDTPTFT